MIKVYLANLGKYNEGELVGEWLELPCTEEEMQEKMVEIGVAHFEGDKFNPYVIETDAKGNEYIYEEYAIHDYEVEDGLGIKIGEYSNLDKLNELAEELSDLNENDLEILKAMIEVGHVEEKQLYEEDLESLIEDVCPIYLEDSLASDNVKLAEAYIDQIYGSVSEMSKETLERYFDFAAFGRDLGFDFSVASNNIAISNS